MSALAIVRSLSLSFVLAVCVAVVGAERLAGSPESGVAGSRYRVTMQVFPGDDAGALARRLAATYRGRLESFAENAGVPEVEISMLESAAQLLSRDRNVIRLEKIGGSASGGVTTNATGSSMTIGPYAYDGSGNISSMGAETSFVYDVFGRLTAGTVAAGLTRSYTYDAFGNRLTLVADGTTIRYGVDPATNRLTAHTDASGQPVNVRGNYDAAGNMLSYDGYATFAYDGAGMVKDSTIHNVQRLYVYTADDERIAMITPAEDAWEFTVRGLDQKPLRRMTRRGSQWAWDEDYIYRNGLLLAAEVPGPEKTRRFHLDHLGTPRLITGNGGAEISRPIYHPFGEETSMVSDGGERLRFTGHERDDRGLDYMHARYYATGAGRFLSVDPTWESADLGKAQSWNRYSYALNNPVRYTDPDGRCTPAVIDCVLEGGSVGGIPGALIGLGIGLGIVGLGEIEVEGKPLRTHVGEFIRSGGGSSGEMAAETMVRNLAAKQEEEAERPELPARDNTGKVHGDLPTPADLREYPTEELEHFQQELQGSVGERIKATSQLGPDKKHGERQAAEQRLIKQIDKIIDDREPK